MPVKIVTVVGARPQFVKAAAVSRAIACHNSPVADAHSRLVEVIVHRSQHFDVEMSGRFFDEMGLPRPDHHLNVHSLNHGAMTRRILERLEGLLLSEEPDWVFIYGDTNSTHVVLDAALFYGTQSSERSHILQELGIEGEEFVLCTFHRAENMDDHEKLNGIVSASNELSRTVRIVMPLHPRTRNAPAASGAKLTFEPISPVRYYDMIQLLKFAQVVMTDSGGLQKEACFL